MEEQNPFDRELEKIMEELPHITIEYAPLTKEELEQRLSEPSQIRGFYSVGTEYIPSQGFTIDIAYSLPELREHNRENQSFKYIGKSGNILSGLLVAEYDDHGRLTIEGISHPKEELKRFSATGNVERAKIIRLPTLFDKIPQLYPDVPVYSMDDKNDGAEQVSLAKLALGRINPFSYKPSAIMNTGIDTSIKPYILSLVGPEGKPVYDGRFGMHIRH
jgi:hypothetical protein